MRRGKEQENITIDPLSRVDPYYFQQKKSQTPFCELGIASAEQTDEQWKSFTTTAFNVIFNNEERPELNVTNQRSGCSLFHNGKPMQIQQFILSLLDQTIDKFYEKIASVESPEDFLDCWRDTAYRFYVFDLAFSPFSPKQTSFFSYIGQKIGLKLSEDAKFMKFLSDAFVSFFSQKDFLAAALTFDFLRICQLNNKQGRDQLMFALKKLKKSCTANEFFNIFSFIIDHRVDTFSYTFLYHIAEFIVKDSPKEYITDIAKSLVSNSIDYETIVLLVKCQSNEDLQDAYKTLAPIIAETAKKSIQDDTTFESFYNFQGALLSQMGEFGVRAMTAVIRTAIGSNSQQISRLLAAEVTRLAKSGPAAVTEKAMNSLLSAFAWMEKTDEFEERYLEGVVARAITGKDKYIEADMKIAELLAPQKRSIADRALYILKDLVQNRKISQEYISMNRSKAGDLKNIKFTILSRNNLLDSGVVSIKSPEQITAILTDFAEFYHNRFGKTRLVWHIGLSRATLKCKNFFGVEKIKCDGIVATILLSITEGMTEEELSEKISLDPKILSGILSELRDPRSGPILAEGRTITFNKELESKSLNVIDIKTISEQNPTVAGKDNKPMYASHESQIDAGIIRALKGGALMSENDIIAIVQNAVEFPVSDDLFQRRVKILLLKHFIEKEGNKYRYLP